jgi:hypothetical protein
MHGGFSYGTGAHDAFSHFRIMRSSIVFNFAEVIISKCHTHSEKKERTIMMRRQRKRRGGTTNAVTMLDAYVSMNEFGKQVGLDIKVERISMHLEFHKRKRLL